MRIIIFGIYVFFASNDLIRVGDIPETLNLILGHSYFNFPFSCSTRGSLTEIKLGV